MRTNDNKRQANIIESNQIAPNQLEDVAEFLGRGGLDGRTVQIDGWKTMTLSKIHRIV